MLICHKTALLRCWRETGGDDGVHPRLIIIIVALCAFLVYGSCGADKGWIGLANLSDLMQLQDLNDGVRVCQASSHDRTGGNDDRGKFLYTSGPEYVMLDVKGPGCIYRLWCTGGNPESTLRFYFDGESVPRKTITIAELFSGTVSPFLTPLVGNDSVSSGGFYSYLPMPFQSGCKITTTDSSLYYNITYHAYTDSTGVTTWTGNEDSSAARYDWSRCGVDPKPDMNPVIYQGTISVPARSSAILLDCAGPGTVTQFFINIPQIVPNDPLSDNLLNSVWIKAYWDNSATPQVCAPLGLFFGSGLGEYSVRSLPIGMYTDGTSYYCFFPMSFASRARIEISNKFNTAITSLSYRIDVASVPSIAQKIADGDVGYFYARHYREGALRFGRDYCILDTTGKGKVVGCVVSMKGETIRHYLEGDERFYIDGSLTPDLYGTGTEDYFNGGWYFNRGVFSLPVHGYPAHEADASFDYTSCYRFHQSDTIPYRSSVRLGLEHGSANDRGSAYESVVYYYQTKKRGMLLTDRLDVGDTTDESRHAYQISGQTWNGMYYKYYEGDDDDISVLDHGRVFTGYSQFQIRIDPANKGVRLVRRMDYAVANVCADVYVDDVYVGTWYDAGSNTSKSWRDTVFEIPPSLTTDKKRVTVKLVNRGGSFNEFFYWVYCHMDTPNLRLEAEDYDTCYDTTAGNATGFYRDGDADIEYCQEGGYAVGGVMAGEWLQFAGVEFPAALYKFVVRHNNEYGNRLIRCEIDGIDITGSVTLPQTSGNGVYYTTEFGPYWIEGGLHQIKIISEESNVRFNYFEFVRVLDLDPPSAFIPSVDPASWTSGPITISFQTQDFPGGWGIDRYEGKIDSGPYQIVTSPWIIQPGTISTGPHTVTIKAVDRAGNYTEASVNIYYALNADSIASIKHLADNTWLMVSGKTVTAAYGNCFYIEEPNRTAGIKVFASSIPAEGSTPSLVGKLVTVAGERVLDCR